MDVDGYVAALEHEKAGYERTGRKDRAKQVADEIARVRGVEPKAETVAPPERPPAGKPGTRGRK